MKVRSGSIRDPNRIDKFLNEIGVLWKNQPDLRFGQIITTMMSSKRCTDNWNAPIDWLFTVEEDKFVEALHDVTNPIISKRELIHRYADEGFTPDIMSLETYFANYEAKGYKIVK